MYSVRVIQEAENRTVEQNFLCAHYDRELENESKENFAHNLTLHGVPGMEDDPVIIDLYKMPEDKHGKYRQKVYVMNENGKTIDSYG